MKIQPDRLLRIHISESDRYQDQPLFEVIIAKCRELKIAGATVFKGLEGYGESAEMHRAHLVRHPLLFAIGRSNAVFELNRVHLGPLCAYQTHAIYIVGVDRLLPHEWPVAHRFAADAPYLFERGADVQRLVGREHEKYLANVFRQLAKLLLAVPQSLLRLFAPGDVSHNPQGVPFAIQRNSRQRQIDFNLTAVFPPRGHLHRLADRVAPSSAQKFGERRQMGLQISFRREHLMQILADRLLLSVPQNRFRRPVPMADLAAGIHHDDGVLS